jgi:hypothetical protein
MKLPLCIAIAGFGLGFVGSFLAVQGCSQLPPASEIVQIADMICQAAEVVDPNNPWIEYTCSIVQGGNVSPQFKVRVASVQRADFEASYVKNPDGGILPYFNGVDRKKSMAVKDAGF